MKKTRKRKLIFFFFRFSVNALKIEKLHLSLSASVLSNMAFRQARSLSTLAGVVLNRSASAGTSFWERTTEEKPNNQRRPSNSHRN